MSEAVALDRRNFGRRRSCIHAICLVAGRPPSPCVVRNWSRTGALLELNEVIAPPYGIRIRLESTGEDIACEVKHARGFYIGVRFLCAEDYQRFNDAYLESGASGGRKRRRPVVLEVAKPMKPLSARDLRRKVLGIAEE
ncbi:MAG TPA: hypothetical protein VFV47_03295 [Hyphomicrobiaceae bacterium]|nr:hypothetical protein [Hyphomicrobiaceae bacterium]